MDRKKSTALQLARFVDHCGKRNHFAVLSLQCKDARKRGYNMIVSVLTMMNNATYTSTQFSDPNISPRFLLK